MHGAKKKGGKYKALTFQVRLMEFVSACYACGKVGPLEGKCGQCLGCVYYSRKCQQDDWHAHKIVCGDDRARPLLQPIFQASKGRLRMGKDRQLVALVSWWTHRR